MARNNTRKREKREISVTEVKEFSAIEGDLHSRIAAKAHELYEARGCCHGKDLDDWLEAERIVTADLQKETE